MVRALDLRDQLVERWNRAAVELVERVDAGQSAQVYPLANLGQQRQVLGPEPVDVKQRDRPRHPVKQILVHVLGLLGKFSSSMSAVTSLVSTRSRRWARAMRCCSMTTL